MINFRVEDSEKAAFENVCSELGISISSAYRMFTKKVIREKRIPFDVSVDSFYSDANMKAIDKSLQQLKEGKIVVKTIEELEQMADE
ncbi:MAG: type II toxin-antitoxin system RelB/DinJ family antitoxin [Treponemataceae bacterium]|nr:type II toxin-antitoxin system RelB/DinJ family antitoxin [Treponemataceae bacterium]